MCYPSLVVFPVLVMRIVSMAKGTETAIFVGEEVVFETSGVVPNQNDLLWEALNRASGQSMSAF
jgi:hypothetical protein